MLQAVLDQLIKTNRVDEEGAIDAIDGLNRDTLVRQDNSVDAVTIDGALMLWLENHARNIQMLRILQSFIDPCFQHLRAHLNLLIFALKACTLIGGSLLGSRAILSGSGGGR